MPGGVEIVGLTVRPEVRVSRSAWMGSRAEVIQRAFILAGISPRDLPVEQIRSICNSSGLTDSEKEEALIALAAEQHKRLSFT